MDKLEREKTKNAGFNEVHEALQRRLLKVEETRIQERTAHFGMKKRYESLIEKIKRSPNPDAIFGVECE